MSKVFNVLAEVLKDTDLSYLDKTVFTALITFNGRGRIFPSIKEIGKRINCNSVNNISVSLNKLKKNGHIHIQRRFQKSSIYKLKDTQSYMKTSKSKKDLSSKIDNDSEYMNNAMIEAVAGQVAISNGRNIPESADYSFVNSLLKLKESDKFKQDNMNTVRKCLMLLYLIKIHSDKFKEDIPYTYFVKVFSNSNYTSIRKKIFTTGLINQTVSFKTGLHNSYN